MCLYVWCKCICLCVVGVNGVTECDVGFSEGFAWYGGCGIIYDVCLYLCVVRDVSCGGWEKMWNSVVHDMCVYIFVYLCVCMVCVYCIGDMAYVYVCV